MSAGRNSWRLNSEVHHEVVPDVPRIASPALVESQPGHGNTGSADVIRCLSGVAGSRSAKRTGRGSKPASPNEPIRGVVLDQ